MKTKNISFRTTEQRYSQIKHVSRDLSLSVTEILERGLTLFLNSNEAQKRITDPWDQAFEKLLKSKKISPLTASERAVVKSYEARKAAGTLRTIPVTDVLADIEAALKGWKR